MNNKTTLKLDKNIPYDLGRLDEMIFDAFHLTLTEASTDSRLAYSDLEITLTDNKELIVEDNFYCSDKYGKYINKGHFDVLAVVYSWNIKEYGLYEDSLKKVKPRGSNIRYIGKNDYIEGYECIGCSKSIKKVVGWVDDFIYGSNHAVLGYFIQADDSWGGDRGTVVRLEHGDIKLISKSKPRVKYQSRG